MDSPVEHEPTPSPTWRGQCLETVLTAGVAVAFCWFFWRVLWSGGGVIGGDLYPYYMPQKFWLQQCFAQGEWPLWNPLVGFGYPILGESQTGAFYPPNLLLYRWLDLNTAYVWSQLGHYILAFMLFTALSRRLGLSLFASWLSATVFVYGWFPPRICLEWAIIGGTWLAGSLWSATAFLQSHRPRWALMVSLCTAMSLLAGHYNLEFITLLMLAAWPLVVRQENVAVWRNGRVWGGLGVALACGFCMGAVQLLPTWELKQLSQRQGDGPEFSATYGHLPPEAISQLWMPWRWYAGNEPMDRSLEQSQWLAVPDATNQAEAQIYVGAIPFLLAVLALWWKRREGESLTASWRWALLAMVGLLLATGWPTYVLRDVPGFSFFRGPGRYSSITVVVLAIWAGQGLDAVRRKWRIQSIKSRLVGLTVVAVSLIDFWSASRQYQFGESPYFGRQVFYATLIDEPATKFLEESPLRAYFAERDDRVRLYAPGPNLPTVLGVSMLPVYLGLGPEIYETDAVRVDFGQTDPLAVAESVEKLRNLGVTHLLLEQQLNADLWQVQFLGEVMDPVLNRAFARREPFSFYELNDPPGRAEFLNAPASNVVQDYRSGPTSLTVQVRVSEPDTLLIRELNFPGWKLSSPEFESYSPDGLFRAVDLRSSEQPITLEWKYQPTSVWFGSLLSMIAFLSAVIAVLVTDRKEIGRTASQPAESHPF